MSQEEKELVFSKTMSSTMEGKLVSEIIGEFLNSGHGNKPEDNSAMLRKQI